MNKVLNINLGGYPFTIDENAYEHLSNYLTSIHNHFRDSEGYEEITEDIESRMAELFQDQLNGRPIVTVKDVDSGIAIMGTPEDFGAEPMDENLVEERPRGKYKTGRRLFRNEEDKVVGGVCSGLAAYFGIEDPLWIRITWIFAIVILGIGLPAYIITWIIVPKAKTAGDRLAMRGEKINVSNIGKIVEEEIESFSESFENFGNDFQSKKKKDGSPGPKRFAGIGGAIKKGFSLLGKGISVIGQNVSKVISVFSKIGKPIFFIVGFALIIALSVIWILSIISFFMTTPFTSYFFAGSKVLSFLGITNVLVFFGVPILALIMFLSKYVFKTRTSPNFKAGMWAFWVVNIISLFGIASYQGAQFNSYSDISKNIDLTAIESDTLRIRTEKSPYGSNSFMIGPLKIMNDKMISANVEFNILKSESGKFELIKRISSRGGTENEAIKLIDAIEFEPKIANGALVIPRSFEIYQGQKWRNQQIEVTLKIPEGKSVYFENDIWGFSHHINIDRNQSYPSLTRDQTWYMDDNGLVNKKFLKKSQRSEEYDYTNFENLQIEGKMKVTIEKGDAFNISLKGKPSYLDKVDFVQLDKTLTITSENQNTRSPIRLTITLPKLMSLDVSSTDDVKVQGFTQDAMRIKADSKKEVKVLAKINDLELLMTENSKVKLQGEGNYLKADLKRKAVLDADRYDVEKAKLDAGDNTKATIAVSDSLWQYTERHVSINVDGSPVIIATSINDKKKQ